jgi:uncharacterized membrane-anchored protein
VERRNKLIEAAAASNLLSQNKPGQSTQKKETATTSSASTSQAKAVDDSNEIAMLETKTILRILNLLEKHKASGLYMESIARVYKETYPNEKIEFKSFGYDTLSEFVWDRMSDCVRVEEVRNGYVVHKMTELEVKIYKANELSRSKVSISGGDGRDEEKADTIAEPGIFVLKISFLLSSVQINFILYF